MTVLGTDEGDKKSCTENTVSTNCEEKTLFGLRKYCLFIKKFIYIEKATRYRLDERNKIVKSRSYCNKVIYYVENMVRKRDHPLKVSVHSISRWPNL